MNVRPLLLVGKVPAEVFESFEIHVTLLSPSLTRGANECQPPLLVGKVPANWPAGSRRC